MKILLCGDINSGKTTLIQRLLADKSDAPRGYITVRMPEVDGVSNVYLYDIANPPERVEDAAVIMAISDTGTEKHPERLDTLGVRYLTDIPAGSVVVLDEIGSLETASPEFQKAVMRILSGDYTVLAAVKAANTDFLRAVRRHPDCELYIITPDNRDALYAQLKEEYNI